MFGKLKLGSSADCLDSEILGALRGERGRERRYVPAAIASLPSLSGSVEISSTDAGGGRENELASFGLEEKHESASHSGGETEIRFGMKFHFPRRKVSSLPYLYPAVQRRNFLKWRSRCRKSRSDLESQRGRKERSSAWIVAV